MLYELINELEVEKNLKFNGIIVIAIGIQLILLITSQSLYQYKELNSDPTPLHFKLHLALCFITLTFILIFILRLKFTAESSTQFCWHCSCLFVFFYDELLVHKMGMFPNLDSLQRYQKVIGQAKKNLHDIRKRLKTLQM